MATLSLRSDWQKLTGFFEGNGLLITQVVFVSDFLG